MDNIAVHMRISGVTVSDEDVNSRRAAATSLATNWAKGKTAADIVSKVADIAEALGGNGNPPPALGAEVQGAIQKKSSSFLYEERPLDISVCAGMAMVSVLEGNPGTGGWTITDVYASALWSALTYQPTLEAERRENLRREVLDAAAAWSTKSAEKARTRTDVPDPSAVKITIDASNAVTNNVKEAMTNTIEALRRNAALDREELDFLWWAQLGRSRLLNKQLSALTEPTRIIAAGIEGARMLRRLPCEVHREIVLRTLDQNPELDLAELLAALGDDRKVLGAPFSEGNVAAHPAVFPLLHALATGEIDESGALVKRHVSEWGARALLEAGLAKMMSQGLSKL
ncbi:GTPase-associated system all-helical protein GASH [Pseudomonas aeruginosa]|uniref:GTPase-associated system all-helical protein GASH n=1 Tax=Pseudomonas aeruginosa TaxID=287 RepID=UPI00232B51C2|nr:GTPase-associated system all-helical protein GASH [Pseudomonas aeruginosa]